MTRKMKALLVSAEAIPFSKAGGLGDVAGALPVALAAQKVDCRLITPLYGFIDKGSYRIRKVAGLDPISIPVGDRTFEVTFYRSNFPNTKTQVFFVGCKDLFDRDGIYTDPVNSQPYDDTPTRFILFSKAVIEFLKQEVFLPDILHLNDYHTALIAPMLRTLPQPEALRSIKLLFAINNAQYQGQEDQHYIYEAGLDYQLAYAGGPLEFYGGFNFMKSGIVHADKLVTVSPTYAKQTMESSEAGFGLEGVLASRSKDYEGILNGVDYSLWDPKNDKLIPKNYSAGSLQGKQKNKAALIKKCDFRDFDVNRPLAGMVTRLVEQKGLDLLLDALPGLLDLELNIVILGKGSPRIEQELQAAQQRYSNHLALFLDFDEPLAHLIEAGSDFYLMPSRFEPCGLNQMYSLRYGTLPIVHHTGGLADSVLDYSPETNSGWGFSFARFETSELIEAVSRACQAYRDSEGWKRLMKRAMGLDFSWDSSAEKYKELYHRMINVQS